MLLLYLYTQETVCLYHTVSQTFLLAGSFWFRKVITDPHILVHLNIDCDDGRYLKLEIYISEPI